MKRLMLSVTAALVLLTTANAQTIRQNEWRTQAQIRQGLRDGSLTPQEARRLEQQQARINRKAYRDARDGNGLTWQERQRLQREQQKLNRKVYRERRDNQTQYRPY